MRAICVEKGMRDLAVSGVNFLCMCEVVGLVSHHGFHILSPSSLNFDNSNRTGKHL